MSQKPERALAVVDAKKAMRTDADTRVVNTGLRFSRFKDFWVRLANRFNIAPGVVSRPLSGTERIWLSAADLIPPFVVQVVFEGDIDTGVEEFAERVAKAVEIAAAAQPSMRMRLAGWGIGTRWVANGPLPPVLLVDAPQWDGNCSAHAEFLDRKLDPWCGPAMELLVVNCRPVRLVIRVVHALMDGGGLARVSRDLFAALRGEPLQGANAGPPVDAVVAKRFKVPPPPKPILDSPMLTGEARNGSAAFVWHRALARVNMPKTLVETILALCAEGQKEIGDGPIRFTIPVDMRKFARQQASTANLTGMFALETKPLLLAPDPAQAIDNEIMRHLLRGSFAAGFPAAQKLRVIPIWLMSYVGRRASRNYLELKTFFCSAVVSHVGRMKNADFSGGGLNTSRLFFLPMPQLISPMFVALVEHDGGLEVAVGMAEAFATDGRLAKLCEGVARRIEQKAAQAEQDARALG